MSPLHLTWAGPTAHPHAPSPGPAGPTAEGDWHESAILHAVTWMLLGLPVMYALAATTAMAWTWLYGVVGWFAVLAVPAPLGLALAVGYGLYFELPRRAWAVHRSRGGPLVRVARLMAQPRNRPGRR